MNESLRFNTGEVELAYSEWPGEGPPVVALHGISASRAALLTRWEEGHHAYAYDHRGHGESARAPGTYTFLTFARDTVEFLRRVVSKPAILVGHSMGGMCAIYAAANAPEFVKAVFLVDPPLYGEGPRPEDDASGRELIEQRAGLPVSELLAMDIPRLRAESLAQLDPDVMRMYNDASAFSGWQTDTYLRAIECPVTLEHGDREGLPPSVIYDGEVERATRLLKDVRVLHMPGTGHAPWLAAEADFFAELSAFIAEQRST